MRISSGIYKGHIIPSPKGKFTRPTSDKVRQAVFNIIGNKINESVFVDLFAGTGAMGIEAASRGSKYVYLNDIHTSKDIKDTVIKFKITDITVTGFDYKKALKEIKHKIDIIYLDPPYKFKEYETILKLIKNLEFLNDNAIIILESQRGISIPVGNKQYVYGDSVITIYTEDNL